MVAVVREAADRLSDLVPGSGHLEHMPSHIYVQVGMWDRSIEQNAKARGFYARMGARDCGGAQFTPPGGGRIDSRRYAWATLADVPAPRGE